MDILRVDTIIAFAALCTIALAVMDFLRQIKRGLEDLAELNWKQLEMLALLVNRPEVLDGFATRTGRVLRPGAVRPRTKDV